MEISCGYISSPKGKIKIIITYIQQCVVTKHTVTKFISILNSYTQFLLATDSDGLVEFGSGGPTVNTSWMVEPTTIIFAPFVSLMSLRVLSSLSIPDQHI